MSEPVWPAKIYVVFNFGDPMPITTCTTPELAGAYVRCLSLLPPDHPLYTDEAIVDEVPLLAELPVPFRCTGDDECVAMVHIHGCFADQGNCDHPEEHLQPASSFDLDTDKALVWEALRKGPKLTVRESEYALHALDRIFDRMGNASTMLPGIMGDDD